MTLKEEIQIICIQWGTAYTATDVNRLSSMIRRNTSFPIRFHLFSNETLPGLSPDVVQHPEPRLYVPKRKWNWNYRKEVGLCDDNLGGLTGQRVFFFDLDVLVLESLDDLFSYPRGDKFYIINDWNTRGNYVGQASCYSFVVGTVGFVKNAFDADPNAALKQFGSASQEYLSNQIIQKHGGLHFWPKQWFRSFRFHCLPLPIFRHFLTPPMPKKGTKVLVFHGHPDIRDAIKGRWRLSGTNKDIRGFKKIYKACRPTPWIKTYWQ